MKFYVNFCLSLYIHIYLLSILYLSFQSTNKDGCVFLLFPLVASQITVLKETEINESLPDFSLLSSLFSLFLFLFFPSIFLFRFSPYSFLLVFLYFPAKFEAIVPSSFFFSSFSLVETWTWRESNTVKK